MGYNNGTYTRNHNFSADASANIKILASRHDAEWDDLASALTNVVWTRDGKTVPAVDIPMGGRKHINVAAATSVGNYMRVREFIENVPIFMQDQESSADRISVSAQYFTSVSANQAPGDGTRILVRAGSDKSSAVMYLNGHSANVEFQDGNRAVNALVSGGVYEMIFSSVDAAWKIKNPDKGRTAAEISAGVVPTNYGYEPGIELDSRRFGLIGDGVTNDSTAIANACLVAAQLGRATIRLYGAPLLVTGISVPANTIIKGDGREATTITKGGNIDMFTLAAGAELRGLALAGNGGTYTGRGVVISSGNHQKVVDCEILDMESYCVEVTSATVGTYGHIARCHLGRADPSKAAIKLPNDGSTASPRYITECTTVAFQILVDCDAAQNTLVRGNFFNNMVFGTSKKTIVVGNRIATTGGALNINGEDNVVVGNAIAGAPTLDSGAVRCVVQGNVSANVPVDNSGSTGSNANWVDIPWATYTCTWTGSSSNPAIGDGTLTAYFSRYGRQVKAKIELAIGSTTTMGAGTWRFSAPFAIGSGPNHFGTLRILDSGTAFLTGISVANAGTSYITAYSHNTGNEVNPTTPITFAQNDTLQLECEFEV